METELIDWYNKNKYKRRIFKKMKATYQDNFTKIMKKIIKKCFSFFIKIEFCFEQEKKRKLVRSVLHLLKYILYALIKKIHLTQIKLILLD